MAEFLVEAIFLIKDRGPVITRSREEGKAARDRGEFFTVGEDIYCGDLTATITGVEHFLVPNAPQQGLLLQGVARELLAVGQTWRNDG